MKIKKIGMLLALTLWSISTFAQSVEPEILQAVIGQNIAVTGEKVWFYVEAKDKAGKSGSNIGYAELVNRNGIPLFQTIFQLANGEAQGYLDIPSQIDSDHYLVRFYTRISPLLGNDGVWNQFITVINPKSQQRKITQNQVQNRYQFKQPSIDGKLNSAKPNSKLNPGQAWTEQPVLVKSALVNPFLPNDSKGFIGGEIYEALPSDYPLIPEPFGHVVYAKNLQESQNPLETFYLSAHGEKSFLNSAKAKPNGDLFFELGAMKDYRFLIVQSNQAESPMSFALQSPFVPLSLKSDFHFPPFIVEENQKDFLLDLVTVSKVTAAYYPKQTLENFPIVVGFDEDRIYRLDDYTRFETFEITLREYVPEVMVRRQNKKALLKVLNKPLGTVFNENPLVLLDGMPVFDIDALIGFDPVKIESMEIMAREFLFNHEKFDGVINIHSFKNDFGGFELPANAIYLNYPLIQRPTTLVSPHVNSNLGTARFPDFRNLLHWEIDPNKPSAVFTSEIEGKYELTQVLRDSDGRLKLVQEEFEVKN
jgi:hypothetical protein